MRRLRRYRFPISIGLALVAAGVVGIFLYLRRVELFLLPPVWREVKAAYEKEEARWVAEYRKAVEEGWPEAWLGVETEAIASSLSRVMQLQERAALQNRAWRMSRLRSFEGADVYLLEERSEERPLGLAVLDAWGHLLPERFTLANEAIEVLDHDFPFHPASPPTRGANRFYVQCHVENVKATLEFATDRRGIVPCGFGTRIESEIGSLETVRFAASTIPAIRTWLEEVYREPPDHMGLDRLLHSSFPGDLFRALFRIEQIGRKAAGLAAPLLTHGDPDVRARAALVIASDPGRVRSLVPLLDDPSEHVRDAAAQALLVSEDVTLARRGLAALLSRRRRGLLQIIPFDFARLRAPEVGQAVLSWMAVEEDFYVDAYHNWIASGSDFWLPVSTLRGEDLRPLTPRLVALSSLVERREGKCDPLTVARWLVRVDDPRADERLARLLASPSDEIPVYEIQSELHARETPLQGPHGLKIVQSIAASHEGEYPEFSPLPMQALLLLVRWEMPGALAQFTARLRRTGGPALTDILFEPETRASGDTPVRWLNHVPAVAVRTMLQTFADPSVTRSRREEVFALLAEILGRPVVPLEIVRYALEAASKPSPPDPNTAVSRAAWRARLASKAAYEEAANAHVFSIANRVRDHLGDVPLCLSILLVGWQAPGALDHLEARLREPGNTWLFDELFDTLTPPTLLPRLDALASEFPERYGDRSVQLRKLAAMRAGRFSS